MPSAGRNPGVRSERPERSGRHGDLQSSALSDTAIHRRDFHVTIITRESFASSPSGKKYGAKTGVDGGETGLRANEASASGKEQFSIEDKPYEHDIF